MLNLNSYVVNKIIFKSFSIRTIKLDQVGSVWKHHRKLFKKYNFSSRITETDPQENHSFRLRTIR